MLDAGHGRQAPPSHNHIPPPPSNHQSLSVRCGGGQGSAISPVPRTTRQHYKLAPSPVEHGGEGVEAVRARLSSLYRAPAAVAAPFGAGIEMTATAAGTMTTPAVAVDWREKVEEAVSIRQLLSRNTEELDAVMRCGDNEGWGGSG